MATTGNNKNSVTDTGTNTTVTDEPQAEPQPTAAPAQQPQQTQQDGPPTERFRVRLSHPHERRRTVFSSVSEKRARDFIARRYPRGSEAYLEHPDGTTEHYEHERTGPYGEDVDQWADFDPDQYQPPEEMQPPGQSAWQDVEG